MRFIYKIDSLVFVTQPITRESKMDCLICFCPIETIPLTCGDPNCIAQTCTDCAGALVNYSAQNHLIPTCPGEKCQAYYLWSEINKLPPTDLKTYEQTCLDSFIKEKGDIAAKQLEQKLILERLREDRRVFIQEQFPKAIAKVAQIALRSKLSALEKDKVESISENLKSAHRICMNLCCNGHLDQNLVCMKCMSSFCQKCEKLLTTNHKCKTEDIESLELIKGIMKCPNCKFPIEKSMGCNGMTCANCKTTFDYGTGELASHGSANAPIANREIILLSTEFRSQLTQDELQLLLEIEAREPKFHSEVAIINLLKKYYLLEKKPMTDDQKQQETHAIAKKIAREIEAMVLTKYKSRAYINSMTRLEKALYDKKLDINFLTSVLHRL